jgi:hypothetical protein
MVLVAANIPAATNAVEMQLTSAVSPMAPKPAEASAWGWAGTGAAAGGWAGAAGCPFATIGAAVAFWPGLLKPAAATGVIGVAGAGASVSAAGSAAGVAAELRF